MDWADEKADKLAGELFEVDWGTNDVNGTECFKVDTPKLAQALRNVQRETAERCAIIAAQHYNHVSGVHAIRERFNMEDE